MGLLTLLLLTGWTACFGAKLSGCENCHQDAKYFVEDKKVFNYYQDWLHSPHKQAGLICSDCHGGDPQATEEGAAHQGVFNVTDPRSKVNFRNQLDTCGQCHEQETRQFKGSHHYQRLQKEGGIPDAHVHAPSCSTCHLAMNRRPYYKNIAERTCRFCHYENNEDDLPMVARETQEILHRLNVSKGYLSWTRLYYKSKGWPGSSKEAVEGFVSQYHEIVTDLHSFDMDDTEHASVELLTNLKKVFATVAADEGIKIWFDEEPTDAGPATGEPKDK
jgi:hypothetical protein